MCDDEIYTLCENLPTLSSMFTTYCEINPELNKHQMYYDSDVIEKHRIAYSRFRTGSHRLKIETGRWSRQPREERLCGCLLGAVQDEKHFLEACEHLSELRAQHHDIDFDLGTFHENNTAASAAFVFKAMEILD